MIAIYNLEPKFFNLALEKYRKFYEMQGIKVDTYKPLWHKKYKDEIFKTSGIYCSSIFSFTPKTYVTPDMICGGTGFDLTTVLPPEIDKIKVYKNFGFSTRGCIRNCPFCVVPQKEGKIHIVGDIYDFWDKKSKNIILMDNNILAIPKHFFNICAQLQKEKLKVDFNQGLDHKLLTPEICRKLKEISHVEYHFAFDDINSEATVRHAIKMLQDVGIKRSCWYVFGDDKIDFQNALYRVNLLKQLGQNAFFQTHLSIKNNRKYTGFARWVCHHPWFQRISFYEFLTGWRNDYIKYYTKEELEYIRTHQI